MDSSRALADALEKLLVAESRALRALPDAGSDEPNRPSGEGWSRREELGHLIDSAVNNHQRFVRASLASPYAGPGYEADAWVKAHRYVDQPWPVLVDLWGAHNAILVPLLRGIPDARLATPCTVADDLAGTLGFLIDDYMLHMRHHLDQIHRRPASVKYPRG